MNTEFNSQLQKWHEENEHIKIINAIEKLPPYERSYYIIGLLARAYNNNDEYDKAIAQLMSVKMQGEDDPLWLFRLAYAYLYKNKNEKALELFEQCKALDSAGKIDDINDFIRLAKQYTPGNEFLKGTARKRMRALGNSLVKR